MRRDFHPILLFFFLNIDLKIINANVIKKKKKKKREFFFLLFVRDDISLSFLLTVKHSVVPFLILNDFKRVLLLLSKKEKKFKFVFFKKKRITYSNNLLYKKKYYHNITVYNILQYIYTKK
jgi:hypothetical protein